MPKASKETASDFIDANGFVGRYESLEGGFTAGFETFTDDVDLTPRLKGLPDDLCQCPHWGYVVTGKLTYRSDELDETIGRGEAFYVPAGHTLIAEAGTEVVFFSPTDEWRKTIAKIGKSQPQYA